MKYHRHLIVSCSQALESIFFEDRYADKCIEYYMRNNKKWGGRDRRFFAETVYDCVRWWRLYWWILGGKPTNKTLPLLAVSFWYRGMPMPDFDEFQSIDTKAWDTKLKSLTEPFIKESIPQWLYDFGLKDLGPIWDEMLPFLNKTNQMVVRTNRLKTDPESLIKSLAANDKYAKKHLGSEDGLIFDQRSNIFKTEAFQNGWFEVQDGSSQQVASYLQVEPGMRVIDACAGAGGKTLHIADILKNKGKIISMDIHQWKLDELKLRARRGGYNNIELKQIEGTKTIKRMKESADRLLLDVPCTGIGVLRRNPDTKWKISKASVEELLKTQHEILSQYSKMLKPGGLMVYATCSLFRCENEDQVNQFLTENDNFKLLKQKRIYPTRDGFDGFYMALLKKS